MAKALEDRVIENAGERPVAGDDITFVPSGRRVRVLLDILGRQVTISTRVNNILPLS